MNFISSIPQNIVRSTSRNFATHKNIKSSPSTPFKNFPQSSRPNHTPLKHLVFGVVITGIAANEVTSIWHDQKNHEEIARQMSDAQRTFAIEHPDHTFLGFHGSRDPTHHNPAEVAIEQRHRLCYVPQEIKHASELSHAYAFKRSIFTWLMNKIPGSSSIFPPTAGSIYPIGMQNEALKNMVTSYHALGSGLGTLDELEQRVETRYTTPDGRSLLQVSHRNVAWITADGQNHILYGKPISVEQPKSMYYTILWGNFYTAFPGEHTGNYEPPVGK